MPTYNIDAAIVGGGIAGAWALNLLCSAGYNTVLFEADVLGCDQTLASQGMIHGGLKYALSGQLTGASEAIARMPSRWRSCLTGDDPVDLRGVRLLSDRYFMFSNDSARGRLTTFFASKALRGRIHKVNQHKWPQAFKGFDGVVYALDDFVLDARSLLETLISPYRDRVFRLKLDHNNTRSAAGGYDITLADCEVHAHRLISCAGNGTAALLEALDVSNIEVQQRPLKQVLVRPAHNVELYAHCLTGVSSAEPRLTITSHFSERGLIWYLGGRLATLGVSRSDRQQIETAKAELETCVPWLHWQGAQFETLYVNRAEPKQRSGVKPDNAFVAESGDFIQCFPTKLTLAPDLGDRLLALLPAPQGGDLPRTSQPRAELGSLPWYP